MSKKIGKRFKKNNITNEKISPKHNKRTYKNKLNKKIKFCLVLLFIIGLFTILYFIFKPKTKNDTADNLNSTLSSLSNIKKEVTNVDNLEASDLKIENFESQSSISLTLYNTSSEICPSQILSISFLDQNNNSIVEFTAYTKEISPHGSQVLQLFTKQDVSSITDFSISKEN